MYCLDEEELEKADFEEIPVETAPPLDESLVLSRLEGTSSEDSFCPLCSRVLTDPDGTRCPHCGADIEKAREAVRLSREIIAGIERAFRQGDFEEAEEGLKQLDQVNLGKVPRGTYLRAKMHFFEKDYARAISMVNSVLETIEDDDDLRNEISEVLPKWQDALRLKLESQEHYNFALSRVRSGYFEEAHEHLLKAIDLASHLPENFRLLGKVCLKLRDYENGRYYLERAMIIDEDDQSALELLIGLGANGTVSAVLIGIVFAIFLVLPDVGT